MKPNFIEISISGTKQNINVNHIIRFYPNANGNATIVLTKPINSVDAVLTENRYVDVVNLINLLT